MCGDRIFRSRLRRGRFQSGPYSSFGTFEFCRAGTETRGAAGIALRPLASALKIPSDHPLEPTIGKESAQSYDEPLQAAAAAGSSSGSSSGSRQQQQAAAAAAGSSSGSSSSSSRQRIVRAKQRLRDEGTRFELPEPDELPERLPPILDVRSGIQH